MLKPLVLAMAMSAATLSASAQGTFDSFGLGDIDPWGIGTLSRADGAMPNTLWQNSAPDDLEQLMSQASVQSMTPSMRNLVRRAVLSSAVRPEGDEDGKVLVKRFEIIQDLGDPVVFEDMVRQSGSIEGVISHFELSIDNDFAKGNLKSACSLVRASSQQTTYLLRARAVCYALEGDYSSALVALEFISGDAADDGWYVRVFNAMSQGVTKNLPPPRYGSGLTLALSIDADLIPEKDGFVGLHPGLAVQVVNRSDISRKLRVQAAETAFIADVMELSEYRKAYRVDPVTPPPMPEDGTATPPEQDVPSTPPVNLLDEAYATVRDGKTDLEQALAFRTALIAANYDVSRYRAVSEGLLPYMNRIQNPSILQQFGDVFAMAPIALSRFPNVGRYTNAIQAEGSPANDPFLISWYDSFPIIMGRDQSPQSVLAVSRSLAELSDETTKPAAIRMIRGFLALGLPVSIEARKLIAAADDARFNAGRTIAAKDKLLISAAFQSGAEGEAILRTAIQVGANPAELNMGDLKDVVQILMEYNYGYAARQLIRDAIGYQLPVEQKTSVDE